MNITIWWSVFSVEEDAFTKLQNYLDDIKDHFSSEDVSWEITQDIEDSISHKFISQKKDLQNVITLWDVTHIIKEMWTIEELTDTDWERHGPQNMSADEKDEWKAPKQLFRNGDEKIIWWVACGIANYFGIDPVITRVIFVILIFANGIWILIYIILWLIVPTAKTASQKLSMKWKPANLSSIEKFFEEKTKKKITNSTLKKLISFPLIVLELLFQVFMKILPILRVFISSVLILISSLIIFVLSALTISILNGGITLEMDKVTRELFQEFMQIEYFQAIIFALFIFLFIPFLLVLLSWFYLLLRKKMIGFWVFFILFLAWGISLSYIIIAWISNIESYKRIAPILEKYEQQDWEYYLHITDR